ncbi:MAG: hypothetical protein JNK87_00785 [Bryobacterales bacterium]|nr:hypothetical protein [Bryobacterales bacterium]
MDWKIVGSITTAFSLVAFLAALGAWLYKASLERHERFIKSAPERDRARLVEAALGHYRIDPTNLTKQQQFEALMAQINAGEAKLRIRAQVLAFVVVVLAAFSAFAISRPSSQRQPEIVDVPKPRPIAAACTDDGDSWWHSKEWRVVSNDSDPFHNWHDRISPLEPPHNAPIGGRQGILVLHPPHQGAPAILQTKRRAGEPESKLSLDVAGSQRGDTMLSVWLNGTRIGQPTVIDGNRWYTLDYELPRSSSDGVLEVHVSAGGQNVWSWETAFIDAVCLASKS